MSKDYLITNKKTRPPDYSMIPSIINDSSTSKRTPEDRAKSPGYLRDRDQTCKV